MKHSRKKGETCTNDGKRGGGVNRRILLGVSGFNGLDWVEEI
jgi:hypothetical protein